MAKQISTSQKVLEKPEFINRQEQEYTLQTIFVNGTVVIAVISVYAILAYVVASYLGSKNKTE